MRCTLTQRGTLSYWYLDAGHANDLQLMSEQMKTPTPHIFVQKLPQCRVLLLVQQVEKHKA